MYRFTVNYGTINKTGEPLIMQGVLAHNGEIALFVLDSHVGEDIGFIVYSSLADVLEKRGKCTIEFIDPVEK